MIIDVENYPLRIRSWLSPRSLARAANVGADGQRGGELDTLIEDWHDFFGLPQGDRDKNPRDQLNIEYQRDGVLEYSQTEDSSGLGDIALSRWLPAGWTGSPTTAAIELPTGSESISAATKQSISRCGSSRKTEIGFDDLDAFGLFGAQSAGRRWRSRRPVLVDVYLGGATGKSTMSFNDGS